MPKKTAICPGCHTKISCEGDPGHTVKVECPNCGKSGSIIFKSESKELDFYPLNEPYAYAKVLKNMDSLEKHYKVIEPTLTKNEEESLSFIWETLMKTFSMRLDEIEEKKIESYIDEQVDMVLNSYDINLDALSKKKILYYIKRESLGFGKIDPLMKDPHIEDISCDGSGVPIFLYHRKYGSVRSNVIFETEDELSYFVIKLAQKCNKHISIAEPMLDATMPDGSRIQMTLSNEVTTKGSTFTIRKFRADPFTPPDLIALNTLSSEILAYFWLAVENRVNALIAGGTASGKTTVLNALSLFIPRESKIVSIEETREINLPHPNWIPGVARSGFGEVVANKMVGEIDMYDLMKAALRQRPEYILVGEIRGKEAYVLFQAMATGHATYSTVHADSAKSLIHRLEGKPIEIPRVMLQSLDVVSIHITTRVKGKRVRRSKQIIEIIDIDSTTNEILTNEVFKWDPVDDKFNYTGKSYILEGIRARWGMTKEDITREIRNRAEILEWMHDNGVRTYTEVAKAVSAYTENSEDFITKIRKMTKNSKVKDIKSAKNKREKQDKSIEKPDNIIKEEVDDSDDSLFQPDEDSKNIIDIFKKIESIDDSTANLLFEKGFKSIEEIKNTSIKDICKKTKLNKKTVNKIKEVIEKDNSKTPNILDKAHEEVDKLIKSEDKNKQKIEVFKDISEIDDESAILLYDNGINTVEKLKEASVNDICKIIKIKKNTVKEILKELKKVNKNSSENSILGGETDASE
jgi:flagellar protein FlaI